MAAARHFGSGNLYVSICCGLAILEIQVGMGIHSSYCHCPRSDRVSDVLATGETIFPLALWVASLSCAMQALHGWFPESNQKRSERGSKIHLNDLLHWESQVNGSLLDQSQLSSYGHFLRISLDVLGRNKCCSWEVPIQQHEKQFLPHKRPNSGENPPAMSTTLPSASRIRRQVCGQRLVAKHSRVHPIATTTHLPRPLGQLPMLCPLEV